MTSFYAWKTWRTEILEEDVDETLLKLLANDTEPIYKPKYPHRRYINPPMHHFNIEKYDYWGRPVSISEWEQISTDWKTSWWVKKGDRYGRATGELDGQQQEASSNLQLL